MSGQKAELFTQNNLGSQKRERRQRQEKPRIELLYGLTSKLMGVSLTLMVANQSSARGESTNESRVLVVGMIRREQNSDVKLTVRPGHSETSHLVQRHIVLLRLL